MSATLLQAEVQWMSTRLLNGQMLSCRSGRMCANTRYSHASWHLYPPHLFLAFHARARFVLCVLYLLLPVSFSGCLKVHLERCLCLIIALIFLSWVCAAGSLVISELG